MNDEIRQAANRILPCLDSIYDGLNKLRICEYKPDKASAILDNAAQKAENICIDLRNLCEKQRIIKNSEGPPSFYHKELFGNITITEYGWIDICLLALLPHCGIAGGTRYVSDSIMRLLNGFKQNGGILPRFSKAFLAIVEHCSKSTAEVFDNDNKGFKAVINALKGRLFSDDNQFELSLGLFSRIDDELCCHIYVMPLEDAGDFIYLLNEDAL